MVVKKPPSRRLRFGWVALAAVSGTGRAALRGAADGGATSTAGARPPARWHRAAHRGAEAWRGAGAVPARALAFGDPVEELELAPLDLLVAVVGQGLIGGGLREDHRGARRVGD